ncbi:MAG: amidohydrolase family protein [Gammaproteobacteria bacterium]|nr:amidohydrolase family protein [Gammaproteobacteria bacterium]
MPYDAIGGPGRAALVDDPAMIYLQPEIRARWLRIPQRVPRWYRYTDFAKKVTGALNRAGVPLMAGTDAMGYPLITPGTSLHRELQLLVESGLTPYEALRAATVAPASFLGKEEEFGTIEVGKRADLLLLDDNPLDNIGHLRNPIGVLVRGEWSSRGRLQQMLEVLGPG